MTTWAFSGAGSGKRWVRRCRMVRFDGTPRPEQGEFFTATEPAADTQVAAITTTDSTELKEDYG